MSTTYTRIMLANKALEVLLLVGLGDSPQAEDTEKVDSYIDAYLAELEARGVVSIPDDDDIDPAFFASLAEGLANECAPAFGKVKSEDAREAIESRIKVMVNRADQPMKLKVDRSLPLGSEPLSLARWARGG